MASSNLPGQRARHCPAVLSLKVSELTALPSLFGFAPGVVCHAVSVAGYAVRSYRTFSPLPAFAACAATAWRARRPVAPKSRRDVGGRFVLCGTFPGVTPAGRYPAPYVDGARTFLSRSLSTIAGAAVQPTDGTGMEAQGRGVKPGTRAVFAKINILKMSFCCRFVRLTA